MNKQELENKVLELENKFNHLIENFDLVPKKNNDHLVLLNHECSNENILNAVIRKPILYFYNMSGSPMVCSIDFQFDSIVDSIPEIREDQKLMFTVDSDNIINDKYKYLYYEIGLEKSMPKPEGVYYVQNNKFLTSDLDKLCTIMNLWNNEKSDFINYWELELKRYECKYYRCDVYFETSLNSFLPIDIIPKPEYFIRRYVKFVPCDKAGKDKLVVPFKQRTGTLRCVEWGGFIDDDGEDGYVIK